MGLGVDSFDSAWMLPVFQAPFSADELTENLPNSSSPHVASLAPDLFVSFELNSSCFTSLLSNSYGHLRIQLFDQLHALSKKLLSRSRTGF